MKIDYKRLVKERDQLDYGGEFKHNEGNGRKSRMEQNRENLKRKIKQLKILRISSLNNKGKEVDLEDKDKFSHRHEDLNDRKPAKLSVGGGIHVRHQVILYRYEN